jgi:four helix bundle protein
MGSASELAYHLFLAHDLSMLEQGKYKDLAAEVIEVTRMLAARSGNCGPADICFSAEH